MLTAMLLLAIAPALAVLVLRIDRKLKRGLPAPRGPHRSRLTAPTPAEDLQGLPLVPSWTERMLGVGIRFGRASESIGSWDILVETHDGRRTYTHEPFKGHAPTKLVFTVPTRDLGLAGQPSPAAVCRTSGLVTDVLFETVTLPERNDLGGAVVAPRMLGLYCRECGTFVGHATSSQAFGESWTRCEGNLHRLVESLESDDVRLRIAEARLAHVESELDTLDARLQRLRHERGALLAKLGAGEPYRDR